jgi:hypothetical protein
MQSVLALIDAVLIVAVSLVLGYFGNERFKGIERRLDRLEDRLDRGLDAVRADITQLALTLVPPREAE